MAEIVQRTGKGNDEVKCDEPVEGFVRKLERRVDGREIYMSPSM